MPGSMKKGNTKPPKTPAANVKSDGMGAEEGEEHAPLQGVFVCERGWVPRREWSTLPCKVCLCVKEFTAFIII